MPKLMDNTTTPFSLWWREVVRIAENETFPINHEDRDSYRQFYEEGYDPREALIEDMSA